MKKFKGYKSKKDLQKELKYYKEFIEKKLQYESDLKSALNKSRSALTLIKEYQDSFNLENELDEFNEINKNITEELAHNRNIYLRQLNNLLKEKVDENNLESLMKLLAMLKSKVDKVTEIYNLHDVQSEINRFFEFIKRLYVIFSSYQVINYHKVAEDVYNFIRDLESENFSNLEDLIHTIRLKVINRKFAELACTNEKMSLVELTEEMSLNEEELMDFLLTIMDQPGCPIKVYNSTDQLVIFRRKEE